MRKFLAGLIVLVAAVYLWNASWLAPAPDGPQVKLIAHRGVHQTFNRDGIESDTCTAERIYQPTHDFIENTIPSMRAAFEAGADVVELDVHPHDGRQVRGDPRLDTGLPDGWFRRDPRTRLGLSQGA